MSYQDRDIAKLKKFANSFGLKVYFRKYTRYTDMAHYVLGRYITIFVSSTTTKDEIILSLLHELGHHIDWLLNGESRDDRIAFTGFPASKHKKYSKVILDVEKAGINKMTTIHKLLNLEIPIKKVKQQQKIDLFPYMYFYKHKKYALVKEMKAYSKKVLNG